jgi:hypothetical protein
VGGASAPEYATLERPGFCAREGADAVRDVFCGAARPQVRSLRELQELLDLSISPRAVGPGYGQTAVPVDSYVLGNTVILLGHSTALSGHLVSPLNPRMIVVGGKTMLAFQRGIQQIELISRARDHGTFNFYLFQFEQACSIGSDGCSPGDLYTPRIEADWTGYAIRDDEQLKNTSSDCRQCHQRARDTPTLLMRERQSPWTHFFTPQLDADVGRPFPGVSGSDLMLDYLQAKGDEPYGGYAVHTLPPVAPFVLETTVGRDQPLLFDAPQIADERYPYGPDGYAKEPQPSPTWERAYEAFKRGEQLALPYLEVRVSDPAKQAQLTAAYAQYRAGQLPADELPDLADIFPDDPYVRARIGLATEPDATAAEALIQACGSCHNDVLDQSLSRARFNIDLARLDPSALALAIERIERPKNAPGAMPPPEARQLHPTARATLLEYLRRGPPAGSSDERLERAAALGMSGGHAQTR